MDNLRAIAVVFVLLVPILTAVALAVRFAGSSRPLNIVDYRKVKDPAALHRWASTRLAILPATALGFGYLVFQNAAWALPLLGVFVILVISVGCWIALGAEKFLDQ